MSKPARNGIYKVPTGLYTKGLSCPWSWKIVDASVERISAAIVEAANRSIPVKHGSTLKRRVPWWNDEVKIAIMEKKRALNIFKRSPTMENMIVFKRCRAKARQIILKSKRISWEYYVSSITMKTPVTEVWRKIRCIMGRSLPPTQPILLRDDQPISEAFDVAEELAKSFELSSNSENYYLDLLEPETPLDFSSNTAESYNAPLTMKELDWALQNSKKTAPGLDSIPYQFIRQLDIPKKEKILNVFNQIWINGTYTEQWRLALVIPVLKEHKDPGAASNYRPISLTSCLSKIMEKIINFRLVWFLENKKLLSKYQMGFRKNRSCIDNLVLLEDALQKGFAQRQHTVAIFFDLEKAFDRTRKYCVIKQLHDWGLRGKMLTFIDSFLSGRKFQVRIGNTI